MNFVWVRFAFSTAILISTAYIAHSYGQYVGESRHGETGHHRKSLPPSIVGQYAFLAEHAGNPRVAIVNPYEWCWEVLFGTVYTMLSVAPVVDVYVTKWDRFKNGPAAFLETIYDQPVQHTDQLVNSSHGYDLIVYVDWYGLGSPSPQDSSLQAILQQNFAGRIWILAHEPWATFYPWHDATEEAEKDHKLVTPEIAAGSIDIWKLPQVEWFAIAPHVAAKSERFLRMAGVDNKIVRWFCPVFPVYPRKSADKPAVAWQEPDFKEKSGFAIQGAPFRRNLTGDEGLLKVLQHHEDITSNSRFNLQIYAYSQPPDDEVPESVKKSIVHKAGLRYQDFFGNMSEALAVMTLFAGDRYFDEAASSTVAVAISCGIPMVVEPEFVPMYTYVNPGATVTAQSRDYPTAIQKVLNMTSEEWTDLAMEMAVTREANMLRNAHLFSRVLRHTSHLAHRHPKHGSKQQQEHDKLTGNVHVSFKGKKND